MRKALQFFFYKNQFRFEWQLKCGFLYECKSDKLPSFFILSSLLGGFAVVLLLHPPKSDDEMKRSGQLVIGPSINYFIAVSIVGGIPQDDLLHGLYLRKKTRGGGGGQKLPILRQHSLWMTSKPTHSDHTGQNPV